MLVRALWGRAERWFVPVAPVGGPVFLTWPGIYDLGASSGSENATQMVPIGYLHDDHDVSIGSVGFNAAWCVQILWGRARPMICVIAFRCTAGQQGSKGLGKPRALCIYIYIYIYTYIYIFIYLYLNICI